MFDWVKLLTLIITSLFFINSAFASERKFNLGKIALKKEVAGWDIDVRPDGKGAPIGKGNAIKGEEIYAEVCASCHGDFGEGIDRWPELVGGHDSLDTHDPVKTTGSYWPYASTIYDYILWQSQSTDQRMSCLEFLIRMTTAVESIFFKNTLRCADIM